MASLLIVVALGGNAIQRKEESGAPEEIWRNVSKAARAIVAAYRRGYRIIVTHGNGPQAGYLLEAVERLPRERPRQTLDIIVAMTQGWLGYIIQHSIYREARRLGIDIQVATIVTRVVVDEEDPAFRNPSKPVGFYYSEDEARRLSMERGWFMKPDSRGGYRRVVPSPRPLNVIEAPLIESLARSGAIVVAAGGGGIPVTRNLDPVEAVVDKDLASALLARRVNADRLVILTDVPGVALDFGKPNEVWLRELPLSRAIELLGREVFPPGSMGPKVAAAIEFVKATGRPAVIGSLDDAIDVIELKAGTVITASGDRVKKA